MTREPPPIDLAYCDPDSRSRLWRTILFAAYLATGAVYLSWRLTIFNPDAYLVSLLFYLIELIGFAGSILLFVMTFRRGQRSPRPAPAGLTVDVFVTTFNEDIDIVRRTLVAAKRIRYPHETWLLDDGDRAEFRDLAAALGCRYLARQDRAGAKAGNLNHALRHARGGFIALFDADHCAQSDFLDRLLGYFDDPAVAFVQTPQDYYNLNSFQHGRDRTSRLIWHEQSGFHHVEQSGRDAHDSATLCGCSCILRRSHVDEVGGFPDETVTEDMHVAVKFQKNGLKTVYHDEPLAYGVAPPDLAGFLLQRLRWGEGNMQVCRIERLPFSRNLTLRQNLSYAQLGFGYADAWRKLALYVAPIGTLVTGVPPVYGEPTAFLAFFLPYLLIGVLTYKEYYAGFGRMMKTEAHAMARMGASLVATWGLFRRRIRFRVSSKRLVSRSALLLVLPQVAIFFGGLYAIWCALRYHWDLQANIALPSMPMEVALGLSLLVAYHCVLAFDVVRETFRSAGTNEPHYRFDVALPMRITAGDQTAVGWTDLISIDAARVQVPLGKFNGRADVTVGIFLPSGRLDVTGILEPVAPGRYNVRFAWGSLTARDELDQALHASRWHRVVTGRHEMALSPLEKAGLLDAPLTRTPEGRAVWEPVLVRPETGGDAGEHLGFLRLTPQGGEPFEVILFGQPEQHLTFEIAAARRSGLTGKRFALTEAPNPPLLDEVAIASCGGRRSSVRLLPAVARKPGQPPQKAGFAAAGGLEVGQSH